MGPLSSAIMRLPTTARPQKFTTCNSLNTMDSSACPMVFPVSWSKDRVTPPKSRHLGEWSCYWRVGVRVQLGGGVGASRLDLDFTSTTAVNQIISRRWPDCTVSTSSPFESCQKSVRQARRKHRRKRIRPILIRQQTTYSSTHIEVPGQPRQELDQTRRLPSILQPFWP